MLSDEEFLYPKSGYLMSFSFGTSENSFSVIEAKYKKETNWYVFYTYPRSEKIIYRELLKRNYEAFLPLIKTLSIWKNRQKKWIDRVVFPSYIFVKTNINELYTIKRLPKIVTYLHCKGRPSIISPWDIECIKRMLQTEENIYIVPNLCEGEKVRIIRGPLCGHTGVLVKQKGRTRFGIQLEEMNHSVLIDIRIKDVRKIYSY